MKLNVYFELQITCAIHYIYIGYFHIHTHSLI